MAWCWVAALSLCRGLGASEQPAAESPPASAEARKDEAVLVGSSSFNQAFGRLIAGELERRGYRVTRKGVSGAGLARPDFHDMNQVLDALPIGTSTAAVLVYLGVNDGQDVWLYPHERGPSGLTSVPFGTAEWDAVYAVRARDFMERICQRGAHRAIVLLPVDVNRADLEHRLERIRDLQVRAASHTSCAVVLRTAGDAGNFEVAGTPMRMPDGFHMSSRGAQVVWERVEPQVTRLLEGEGAVEVR